jgi:hypothetical protein
LLFGKTGKTCHGSLIRHSGTVYKASLALWCILIIFLALASCTIGLALCCPKPPTPELSPEEGTSSTELRDTKAPKASAEAYVIHMDPLEETNDGLDGSTSESH